MLSLHVVIFHFKNNPLSLQIFGKQKTGKSKNRVKTLKKTTSIFLMSFFILQVIMVNKRASCIKTCLKILHSSYFQNPNTKYFWDSMIQTP